MTYRGKIHNGVVVLNEGSELPDGIEVEVLPMTAGVDPEAKSLQEKLLNLSGKLKGYPPDLAKNHDHYIHGAPKKP
jgi:hypothetical protein